MIEYAPRTLMQSIVFSFYKGSLFNSAPHTALVDLLYIPKKIFKKFKVYIFFWIRIFERHVKSPKFTTVKNNW